MAGGCLRGQLAASILVNVKLAPFDRSISPRWTGAGPGPGADNGLWWLWHTLPIMTARSLAPLALALTLALTMSACSLRLTQIVFQRNRAVSTALRRPNQAQVSADEASVFKVVAYAGDVLQEGSGFEVAADEILTNNHVIAGAGRLLVDTSSGVQLPASLVVASPTQDLALLSVADLGGSPLPLAPASPTLGLPVIAVGYPAGGAEVATTGHILGTAQVHVQSEGGTFLGYVISAPVQPGNSGGPLLDPAGQVVGVVFARAAAPAGPAFALLWSQARAFLATNGVRS